MYTEFFNLKEKPFNLTPSPRFLYLSEGHKEALALLRYGVMERKGFILLTGEVGTGKTTIVRKLIESLEPGTHCVYVSNPLLSPEEFIQYVAYSAFKEKIHFKSKVDFLIEIDKLLRGYLQNQKSFILIIDEAQDLSIELLEEVRLLSNLEYADEKLINIFLVGQPELNVKLSEPESRALLQRIVHRYDIPPLDAESTRGYLLSRLKTAGAKDEGSIFSAGAMGAIHRFSGGYPRKINVLADNALLMAYGQGKRTVTAGMVEKSYRDGLIEVDKKVGTAGLPAEGEAPSKAPKRSAWKWAAILIFVLLSLFAGFTATGRSFFSQVAVHFQNATGALGGPREEHSFNKVQQKVPPLDRAQGNSAPVAGPVSHRAK